MKKILYTLLALICIAGCDEPTPTPPTPVPPEPEPAETLAQRIITEWHCVISDINADIYVSFGNVLTFDLYQKIGDGSYRLYRGTWELDEEKAELSGKYNDGTPWGSAYAVSMSDDGNSMTLSPLEGSENQIYKKEEIPADVKDNAVVIVKSETGPDYPVL